MAETLQPEVEQAEKASDGGDSAGIDADLLVPHFCAPMHSQGNTIVINIHAHSVSQESNMLRS